MGTPVVTTRAAFRGIDASDGDGIVVADDSEGFAQKVVQVLENRQLAAEMGRQARRLVERRYVWDEHLALLERLIVEAACASGPSRRPATPFLSLV